MSEPQSCKTMGDMLARASSQFGDSVFLIESKTGEKMTFNDCYNRAISFSHALRFQLDVPARTPVGIMSPNCMQYLEVYFGNAFNGSSTANIAPQLAPVDLAKVINNTQTRVLLVHPDCVAKVDSVRSQLQFVELFVYFSPNASEQPPFDYIHYQKLLDLHSTESCDRARLDSDVLPEDPFALFLTSGTTSTPKAVVRSHLATCTFPRNQFLEFQPNDTFILSNSLAWVGAMVLVRFALVMQARLVVTQGYKCDEYLTLIERYSANMGFLMPKAVAEFSHFPKKSKAFQIVTENIQKVLYGGAPTNVEVIQRFQSKYPSIQLLQGYGLTETMFVTVLTPEEHVNPPYEAVLSSVGRPMEGVKVVVMKVDSENPDATPTQPAKFGEVGELWVNNNTLLTEYYLNKKATEESLPQSTPGWYRTGDLAIQDENGYVYIKSRVKDMIVVGDGYNVYASDVEAVLSQHPMVADVAVAGVRDKDGLEHVTAFVIPQPSSGKSKRSSSTWSKQSFSSLNPMDLKNHIFSPRPDSSEAFEQDLLRFCEDKLCDFQKPEAVFFMEAFPRNHNQKVQKRKLREPTPSSTNLFQSKAPNANTFTKGPSCGAKARGTVRKNSSMKTFFNRKVF